MSPRRRPLGPNYQKPTMLEHGKPNDIDRSDHYLDRPRYSYNPYPPYLGLTDVHQSQSPVDAFDVPWSIVSLTQDVLILILTSPVSA
jgi:hypothetical protein